MVPAEDRVQDAGEEPASSRLAAVGGGGGGGGGEEKRTGEREEAQVAHSAGVYQTGEV